MKQWIKTSAFVLACVIGLYVYSYFDSREGNRRFADLTILRFPPFDGTSYGLSYAQSHFKHGGIEINLLQYNSTLFPKRYNDCFAESDKPLVVIYDEHGTFVTSDDLLDEAASGSDGMASYSCVITHTLVFPHFYHELSMQYDLTDPALSGSYDIVIMPRQKLNYIPKHKPPGPSLRITVE